MKNKFTTLFFAVLFNCLLLVSTSFAQMCTDFKNKTYIAFGETIFDNAAGDDSLKGAFAFKVKFDSNGTNGTARFMVASGLPKQAASQQTIKFLCADTGSFTLTEKNLGDNAYFLFKSFDSGAKIWVKSNIPGRDTPFWMIEQPAEPRGEQFPKKTN